MIASDFYYWDRSLSWQLHCVPLTLPDGLARFSHPAISKLLDGGFYLPKQHQLTIEGINRTGFPLAYMTDSGLDTVMADASLNGNVLSVRIGDLAEFCINSHDYPIEVDEDGLLGLALARIARLGTGLGTFHHLLNPYLFQGDVPIGTKLRCVRDLEPPYGWQIPTLSEQLLIDVDWLGNDGYSIASVLNQNVLMGERKPNRHGDWVGIVKQDILLVGQALAPYAPNLIPHGNAIFEYLPINKKALEVMPIGRVAVAYWRTYFRRVLTSKVTT